MTFAEMHVKWSLILADRLGPEILTMLEIKGQVLHLVRVHLKVPGWLSDLKALLTRKLPMLWSRLNEISGGREKMCWVAIPFSQFLRLRRLCSNDSDFNNKCEEMCQFFKKRGYPDSAITTGKHRAQEIDRNTALQSPQDEETNRIPFTLTYHPQNLAVKNVILKNFKILRNDPETQHIFSLPPLISFKRDKNIGNFLVRSAFKSDNQPGTFKCTRTRCKTCPFISNMVKISGPNRSAKISDHFTCISANVIYCITCTLCKKIYIGETGRRLADRFREQLRDVEKNDTDASKPVARHFNLPNHSHHNMTICGLSLHHGNTESRKNLEQKFIFQLGTLYPHGINERLSFH